MTAPRLHYITVVVFATLAAIFVIKGRQYQADMEEQIQLAERAIQERDIFITNCEEEQKNTKKEIVEVYFSTDKKIKELAGPNEECKAEFKVIQDRLTEKATQLAVENAAGHFAPIVTKAEAEPPAPANPVFPGAEGR